MDAPAADAAVPGAEEPAGISGLSKLAMSGYLRYGRQWTCNYLWK